jgi:hypothetical protein
MTGSRRGAARHGCGIMPGKQEELPICGPRRIKILSFPKWYVVDVEHERTEIVSQWEIERTMGVIRAKGDPSKVALVEADPDKFRAVVMELLQESKSIKRLSADQRIAQGREQCKRGLSLLFGNVMRLEGAGEKDRTRYGEIAKKINWTWIRQTGRRTDEMTEDDLREKYKWLAEINEEVVLTREVPSWLKA